MVAQSPRRNRRVNSGIPHVLPEFLARLARATRWEGDLSEFVDGESIRPGSARNPWRVDNPGGFGVDYLWQEILSKFDDQKSSGEKESKALERFKQAEEQCRETNMRLSIDRSQVHHREPKERLALLDSARRKIARLLGPFDWNEAAEGFTFTGGASTRVPRKNGDHSYKYSGVPESTFNNLDLATAAIRMVPAWERRLRLQGDAGLVNIRDQNKVITVPKNYKTDRVIAVEPDMNMYIQKGLAACIRKRLRKVGIDIRSQSLNQDLALYASKTGAMATIDMSMASDTVSLEFVRHLLPPEWLAAFEQCRTTTGVLPCGTKVLYRKFSSMGNGYTFELETLLFWSLASAVCSAYGVSERLIAVYGDDIVVPSSVALPLIELLSFCGFSTNESKTFIDGPFRESCGKHYISGFDVTPFYVRKQPSSLLDLFLLHNQLYRWCSRNQWNDQWDRDEMRSLLSWLRSQAPKNWRRPRIPDGIGDGAFIGTFDECTPKVACTYRPGRVGKRDGWEGYVVEVLADVSVTASYYDEGFGTKTSGKFEAVKKPPEPLGWLLKSLARIPQHRDTLFYMEDLLEGTLSLGTRAQVVTTLVPQWVDCVDLLNT